MRKIEFKGKRKDNGEWIYGSLIISKGNYYITEGYCEIGTFDLNFIKYEVIPETIGQYTGLKDKNGKKIFEGDIVKTYNNEICIVIYNYNQFGLSVVDKSKTYGWVDFIEYNLEIIGNIWDNPELLKEG